nr:hypothetical protein [uncultured Tyzzerella sp.]
MVGGGFIYNKLFFSFYNIDSFYWNKNINIYSLKKHFKNNNKFFNYKLIRQNNIKNFKSLKNIDFKSYSYKYFNKKYFNQLFTNYIRFYNNELFYKQSYNIFNENIIYEIFNKRFVDYYKINYFNSYKNFTKHYNLQNDSALNQNLYNNILSVINSSFYKNKENLLYNFSKNNYVLNKDTYKNFTYKYFYKTYAKEKLYFNNKKNINNINNIKNSYIKDDFKNISKKININSNIYNKNTNIKKIKQAEENKPKNIYNTFYEEQLEKTKNLDYDFIFDKVKEMIFEELSLYVT